ncbi:hypothetical protein BOQ62_08855 [Chryseobacterium sp. CH21]|uniref:leucine-rich repeat domain-containing protein n=1 Tax=Chryseobacterium sp. CH21 TaxID=713556 RepID=UPI00100A7EA2|nr:leucine-rich repeat domain-containing protein [Chryseobacterium sp. CH21]RXM39993.1 hypothetical protein BOQ62_08855 [Chryseobacterium sp. CH21]
MKTKEELKLYFENGDIPKQEDFWEWQNSYWHKSEKLQSTSIDQPAYEEFLLSPTDNTEIIGLGRRMIIPEGIKTVGGFIYSGAAKNTIIEVQFPKTLEKLKSFAFAYQFLKGSLKIPGTCKTIEASAFLSGYANISELILENGIETIDSSAFQLSGSTALTELYIPKSVKSVGQNAFNIPSLKKVSVKQGLDISNAGIPATATISYYTDI